MDPVLGQRYEVRTARHVVSDHVGPEVGIVNLESLACYSLEGVGARIWTLVCDGMSLQAIVDALVGEYNVGPDRCERDVLSFLEQLTAENLIEVTCVTHSEASPLRSS